MNQPVETVTSLREKIIADPESILEDRDVMSALVSANNAALGENIVDLRGIALSRLEGRLDRLEDTHRSVIAAAYENLAGTTTIHRAILRMLEPTDFAGFLVELQQIGDIMRVDEVRLVLESAQDKKDATLSSLDNVLVQVTKGSIDEYVNQNRNSGNRTVTLRQITPENGDIYGRNHSWIRSEACLKLNLGEGRLPGMLVMGSEDPHQFKPAQGVDLLEFMAGVFERTMVRWLA